MEIKTLQEWIEYGEEIEQTCHNGEEVFDIQLIFRNELIDRIETICNHGNERDMRFRNLLLKELNAFPSDSEHNSSTHNKDLEVSASPTPKESQKAIPSLNPYIKRNLKRGLQYE